MRPLRLEVQGFMAFKGPQQIDFAGLDLFAIVGPTGSGKSALLDAMTFALYGSTPRLGKKDMKPLISTGESVASVSLEFEVRGERYKVARRQGHKSSGNQVSLEQELDGRWRPLSGNKVADINARIVEAVGLDFAAFTRAVLLPQGEFSAFLKGTGLERQKLLGELTNLGEVEHMAVFARTRWKELD
ncbi:MAG: AAA family ATPase, partial [Deinococcus sp.]